MLPDNIDNVRLILDLDNLARSHGMRIQDISVDNTDVSKQSNGTIETSSSGEKGAYGSVVLSFSTQSSYETFKEFLVDLERGLRLTDVIGLAVVPNKGNFDYKVNVRTYWLK